MIRQTGRGPIQIRYENRHQGLSLDGPASTYALRSVMSAVLRWPYLRTTAEAIFRRNSFGAEDFHFRYYNPEVLDVGEAPWEGVEIETIEDVEIIPEPEFEQLMLAGLRVFLQHYPPEGRVAPTAEDRDVIAHLVELIEQRNSSINTGLFSHSR